MFNTRLFRGLGAASMLLAGVFLTACGGKKKAVSPTSSANTLAFTVSGSGTRNTYSGPVTARGGVVKITLTNRGTAPHAAQLALVLGGHTVAQALKIIDSQSSKTPPWLRGEGGVGTTLPGQTGQAWVSLPAGRYVVTDLGGPGSSGPPAYTQMTLTAGPRGSLPSTATTIAGAHTGKQRYAWKLSGTPLKVGLNTVMFKSEGEATLHMVAVFRITGKHSDSELVRVLGSNARPPAYVDLTSFFTGTVLDSGRSAVIQVPISKPGTWVLFCPMTDRDGGKPHFKEGMVKQITVT